MIVVAVTAAFWNSLGNGFTNWDDDTLIVQNELIREVSFANLAEASASSFESAQGPLAVLSLAVDHAMGGLDPAVFHRTSLVIHVASCLVLFALLARLGLALPGAIFGALLFGLHPLHVESVAWASERKDVLCAFFFFLAVYFYQGYVETRSRAGYGLCLAAFGLALASKPMAVSLPLVLLAQDHLVRRRWSVRLLTEKIPFVAGAAAVGLLTWLAQEGSMPREGALGLGSNILIAIRGIAFYLAKLVLPRDLSAFYPYPDTISVAAPQFATAIAAVIAAGFVLWRLGRRSPLVAFGALFFVLTLLPVLKLIPVGNAAAADRYTYIPSVGIFLIAGAAAARLWERAAAIGRHGAARAGLVILGAAILAALGIATSERCTIWRDSESLWKDVIAKYPSVALAHYNLGLALRTAGDEDGAFASYRTAITLDPRDAQAHNNLADILIDREEYGKAWNHCTAALDIDPEIWQAHRNAAVILGARGDYSAALAEARRALEINSRSADAAYLAGLSLCHLGRQDEAIPYLEKAVSLRPALRKAVEDIEKRFE